MCRRYEIYVFTPFTAGATVASGLDYKLPRCNKVLIGKDLLFFGFTHNKQHPEGAS